MAKPHFSEGKITNELNKVLCITIHIYTFFYFHIHIIFQLQILILVLNNPHMGSSCRTADLKRQVKSLRVTAGTRGSKRQFSCLREDYDDASISLGVEGERQTLNIKSRSLFDSLMRRVTGGKHLTLTCWNAVKI